MNVINTTLNNLRHSEYIEYMRDYLKVCDENDPDALGVRTQFDALMAKVGEIEAIHKKVMASELTAVIADLDNQRDAGLMSISFVIRGYMGHYDQSKAQDAQRLNTRLNVYGGAAGLSVESLQGQSASLDNLIVDFQSDPALQAAVASLGLTDWMGQLKIVNDNLRSAYFDRTKEKGAAPAEKTKDLRNEGNGLFYNLRDFLLANALLVGYVSPYDTVINETNALAVQYNDMLAQRSGTASNPGGNGGEDDIGDNNNNN